VVFLVVVGVASAMNPTPPILSKFSGPGPGYTGCDPRYSPPGIREHCPSVAP
jgi:hypothetical protein